MSTQITVTNPDDPFGSPSYEGPADEAHTRLAPGTYATADGGSVIVTDSGTSRLVDDGTEPANNIETITIEFAVTIEVSPEEWDLTYDTGTMLRAVREDVRETLYNILDNLTTGDAGAGDGAIKKVTRGWS